MMTTATCGREVRRCNDPDCGWVDGNPDDVPTCGACSSTDTTLTDCWGEEPEEGYSCDVCGYEAPYTDRWDHYEEDDYRDDR